MQQSNINRFLVKKLSYVLCCLLFLCVFVACEKQLDPSPNPIPVGSDKILLVGNEGSFGTNTASLSLINLDDQTVANNVFKNSNGQPLGDVLQSMTRMGAYYYFALNNSNKILITDSNFVQTGVIDNIVSPRYIQPINENVAYVSSLFNDKMYVIDLNTQSVLSEIQMDKNWTEEMVLYSDVTGNYVFVCEKDTAINYITKINTLNHQIVDRINIAGFAPSEVVQTGDQHLWILGGNNFHGKVGTLSELDPSSNQILQSFTFPAEYTVIHLAVGPQDEKYVTVVDYNTNEYGIFKFEKNATSFPTSFFVQPVQAENFYGVTVDPENGDVYISDTKGFTQAGAVNRYSSTGAFIQSWTSGIGPRRFDFVR